MHYANADPRVPGYTGRALSQELSADQLYSTQARLLGAWGLAEVSKRMSEKQEQAHAQHLEQPGAAI